MNAILALDIGGIVFEPRWRLYGLDEVSKKLGKTKEQFKSSLAKYKKDFYTGKISEEEYWRSVLNDLNVDTTEDLSKLYREYVTLNVEVLPILNQLKEKYILVACNNCPKEWMDYRVEIANLNTYFSQFITSGYVGHMKPNHKIYELLIESFSGHDIIYMDDDPAYVETARSLGIKAVQFQDLSDLKIINNFAYTSAKHQPILL